MPHLITSPPTFNPHHIHDLNFKELMSERAFFEPFLKAYLPQELQKTIDWNLLEIHRSGPKRLENKTQENFEPDLIYFLRSTKNNSKKEYSLCVHIEHQTSSDPLMPLRISNYQTAELLAYAKHNPGKKLPIIFSLIYYQG